MNVHWDQSFHSTNEGRLCALASGKDLLPYSGINCMFHIKRPRGHTIQQNQGELGTWQHLNELTMEAHPG